MADVDASMLQKLTGNPPDELLEAGYRLAASRLSSSLVSLLEQWLKQERNTDASFLQSPWGPLLFDFALSSLLEVIPGETLSDVRSRVAYNLRVQAYQALGDKVASFGLSVARIVDSKTVEALSDAGLVPPPGRDVVPASTSGPSVRSGQEGSSSRHTSRPRES